MSTFGIIVFYGGKITSTPQVGVEYSIPARFTLEGNKDTTFDQLKSTIFQLLSFQESQYSIEIQCRINIAQPPYFYFDLISIYDESSWRMACEMCLQKMGMIQLYVQMNQIANNQIFTGSQPGTSNASQFISQSPPISTELNINNNENEENDTDDDKSDD